MGAQESIYDELEHIAEEIIGEMQTGEYTISNYGDSIGVFFTDEVDETYDGPLVKLSYGDRGGHRNDHTFHVTALDDGTQPYNEEVKGLEPRKLPSEDTIREMLSAAVEKVSQ